LQQYDIRKIVSDNSSAVCIVDDYDAVLFWGWPLCTRTSYRFLEHYDKIPNIINSIQNFTPLFKSGKNRPIIEAEFEDKIMDIQMGGGYLSAIDSHGNVFSWGDNYAGQLGTLDDIHRDEPCLVKSLSEVNVV
jgi:hypothetical protein